ncbi:MULTISPECIES: glyoxalase/bleomycin resistance/dioxygenase family protein [unclassified Streptomyces]|uniref:glyoxalase/bleomycin resistance/dioxygenase family protein n=1 Tax=unclassified Streptomyces TaxID=2593676 RepID=UPI000DC7EE64|nr:MULTISPECIES: glyoxalase/bleomycin resistance/dioxygenase family protein [unclassified Streptomyces]AWZ05052.1 glyoxalase/bleomycin resistance/dioxygenase family protein [Streptomyces sp. ICC4]AWZ12461.1 glyoxalase/bleomycin resistance/dioxygenase family protein [Streptomyces sp. ICC1]
MSEPSSIRATLLVLYSPQLEACRDFYSDLGLRFATEQHGQGPRHYAAVFADGTVFEIYPARPGRETSVLRLGLTIPGTSAKPPLAPGHHLLTDPDGRTIAIQST